MVHVVHCEVGNAGPMLSGAVAAVSACTRCNDVSNSTSLTTYGSGRMSGSSRATRSATRRTAVTAPVYGDKYMRLRVRCSGVGNASSRRQQRTYPLPSHPESQLSATGFTCPPRSSKLKVARFQPESDRNYIWTMRSCTKLDFVLLPR